MQRHEILVEAEKQFIELIDSLGYSFPSRQSLQFDTTDFNRLVASTGNGKKKAKISYKAWLNETVLDGKTVFNPAAIVYDHESGQRHNWKMTLELTAEQQQSLSKNAARIRQQNEQRQTEQARKQKASYDHHAHRCQQYFSLAKDADSTHPYLADSKQVKLYTRAKIDNKGNLVLPVVNSSFQIRSMQRINATGSFKSLKKGAEKSGNFIPLKQKPFDRGDAFLIGEGYATTATGLEATGINGFAAVDAGNIFKVVKSLKQQLPQARFYYLVDHDKLKDHKGIGEIRRGEYECKRTQIAFGGILLTPDFDGSEIGDWNDLKSRKGIDEVTRQIAKQVLLAKGLTVNPETKKAEFIPGAEYLVQPNKNSQKVSVWKFEAYREVDSGRRTQIWSSENRYIELTRNPTVMAKANEQTKHFHSAQISNNSLKRTSQVSLER